MCEKRREVGEEWVGGPQAAALHSHARVPLPTPPAHPLLLCLEPGWRVAGDLHCCCGPDRQASIHLLHVLLTRTRLHEERYGKYEV